MEFKQRTSVRVWFQRNSPHHRRQHHHDVMRFGRLCPAVRQSCPGFTRASVLLGDARHADRCFERASGSDTTCRRRPCRLLRSWSNAMFCLSPVLTSVFEKKKIGWHLACAFLLWFMASARCTHACSCSTCVGVWSMTVPCDMYLICVPHVLVRFTSRWRAVQVAARCSPPATRGQQGL
ncbi:hypothetical protein VPH35_053778 [Triticum aestivum]